MTRATLSIDLDAIVANWRALARLSGGAETAAVVKADAYGLGAATVATALARAGARSFFVAQAEEGAALRACLGPGPAILVLSGHMAGDTGLIRDAGLVPMLNSPEQAARHLEAGELSFGVQLDTGMNRLGVEAADWLALAPVLLPRRPALVMSHLACADEPDHPANARQLDEFRRMTGDIAAPRSLAATGGILLGPAWHFDLTRPGIGLYGGAPYADARPVLRLSLPVIQVRDLAPGEGVGYGLSWTAAGPARIATVAAGYADGLPRALSGKGLRLWAGDAPCPVVGRVSMDMITVDVTRLPETPEALDILGPHQGIEDLAALAGTIGYEILTALGPRYARTILGGGP
jgi:alanine racemase